MKIERSGRWLHFRSFLTITAVIGIVLTMSICHLWAETVPTVVVKNEVWVKGEKVYLKDVARIECSAPLDEVLGDTYLAYAPSPGMEKTLNGAWIKSKVRSKRWLPKNIVIDVPEFVKIGRTCQTVEDETYLRRYTDYIVQRIKGSEDDIMIRRFKVIGNRPFPAGELQVKLINLGKGELVGHVNLRAIVRIDGEVERRVSLSGWVDRFKEVVCACQPLLRHSVISEEDLCLKRRNLSKLPNNVVKIAGLAIGKRLKNRVESGSVLLASSLEDVPVVKRGDRVTIVVESSSVRVTAFGIAQDKGSVGDQICVRNCLGGKEIFAGIVDSSTVKIDF